MTVELSGNIQDHLLMARYEEMVTKLYCEPKDELVMGSYLKKDEEEFQQPPRSQSKKPLRKSVNTTRTTKSQDIRNPPKCN